MPFDTTYHIPSGTSDITITHIKPGGADTNVYLNQGELPPGVDSLLYIDSLLKSYAVKGVAKETSSKSDNPLPLVFFVIFIFVVVILKRKQRNRDIGEDSFETEAPQDTYIKGQLYNTYYGDELNFADEELAVILIKHFPYFNSLSQIQQGRFLQRLQNFIANKTFKIYDNTCYKEMPVLISAAAIQLTFGLEKYLLPNFGFIHVYPQEFMRVNESICFLEGNVSGHAINLSWKHFLEGYANPNDGQNVGLHELAHALYYQTFIAQENVDSNFRNTFEGFNNYGNKVFEQESLPGNDLYSDYALRNFQEFWAESVEIFFEKPSQMKASYPLLYETLQTLLNQDPYNKIA